MAFPVTLNGTTYTLADFEGTNYVDGFPNALEDFVTQAGDIYNSTSTSSVAIGTGEKSFTTADSGKPYQEGTPLRIADAAAPETNFMDCIVTSYSGTSLVVESIGFGGTGTKSSWTINIGGAKTVDGTLAINQGGTGATTASAAASALGLGTEDSPEFTGLTVTSSGDFSGATISDLGTVTTADINGGTIDGVTINDSAIGGSTPAAGSFTTITGSGDMAIDTDTLFVDVSENRVGIGTTSPSAALEVRTSGGIDITSDNTYAPELNLHFNTADVGGTENRLLILANQNEASIRGINNFPLTFQTNNTERMRLDSSGNFIFNEDSTDSDFRVESDSNTHLLFVDAGNGRVGIGESAPDLRLHVSGGDSGATGNSAGQVFIEGSTSAGISIGSSTGNSSYLWFGDSDNIAQGRIRYDNVSDKFEFRANNVDDILVLGSAEAVFNEESNDQDFRVESNNDTHALFVDAGTGRVGIKNSSPDHALDVNGTIALQPSGNLIYNHVISVPHNTATELVQFGTNSGTGLLTAEVTLTFYTASQAIGYAKYLVAVSKLQSANQYAQSVTTIQAPTYISKNAGAATWSSVTLTFAKNANDAMGLTGTFVTSGAGTPSATAVYITVMSMGLTPSQIAFR